MPHARCVTDTAREVSAILFDRLSDTITIRLSARERAALEQLAHDERCSVGRVTREAIGLLFADRGVERPRAVA
jgi:hypothetical protein